MAHGGFGTRSDSTSSHALAFTASGSGFDPVTSHVPDSVDFGSDGAMDFGLSSRNSTSGILTPEDGTSFAGSLGGGSGMTPLAGQMDLSQLGDRAHSFAPVSYNAKKSFEFDTEAIADPLFDDMMAYEN